MKSEIITGKKNNRISKESADSTIHRNGKKLNMVIRKLESAPSTRKPPIKSPPQSTPLKIRMHCTEECAVHAKVVTL